MFLVFACAVAIGGLFGYSFYTLKLYKTAPNYYIQDCSIL